MILGIGNDMVDIRRIERSIERFGKRFMTRVFSEIEQRKAGSREKAGARVVASTYAKRFAAKEACSKALGTGFRQGVYLKDICVENGLTGKPTLLLTNGAKQALERMLPKGSNAQIDLTMTDDYPYAQAIVVISAVPA